MGVEEEEAAGGHGPGGWQSRSELLENVIRELPVGDEHPVFERHAFLGKGHGVRVSQPPI
jgi:hypothetical protein